MTNMTNMPKKSKNGGVQAAVAKPDPAKSPAQKPAYSTGVQTAAPKPEPAKPAAPKPGHVSLELVKPGAKQVFVAGSFNEWKPEKTPLAPSGNGRWIGDLTVRPGRYEYLFVVDGQWIPDPNAKESVANPFGGKNSVFVASQ